MKLIKKSSKKNKDFFENLEAATFDALIQEGEPHISDLANFYTRCFLAHPPRNMYLFVYFTMPMCKPLHYKATNRMNSRLGFMSNFKVTFYKPIAY